MSLTVVELEQTCGACPSQWEGRTDDGRYVYIRYRWGFLRLGVGYTFWAAVGADTWGEQIGDGLDGSMDEFTMRHHLRAVMEVRRDGAYSAEQK
jgi:hypothetical protein